MGARAYLRRIFYSNFCQVHQNGFIKALLMNPEILAGGVRGPEDGVLWTLGAFGAQISPDYV